MGTPIGWHNRAMFARYIYDYLKKKELHETAQIFWEEAILKFEPASSPEIDIPEGFLHEWWLTFYDIFGAQQSKVALNNVVASYVAKKMISDRQPCDSNTSREDELNEQILQEMTASNDSGLTSGGNLMVFNEAHQKTEQGSQDFKASQPQEKSFTIMNGCYHPGNLDDIATNGVGNSVCASLDTEKIVPNERGMKRKSCACSESGVDDLPRASGTVKLSSLHYNNDEAEGKTSCSSSQKSFNCQK